DAVVGYDQEAGAGGVGDLAEQSTEPIDIGVVERRVDLVEDANRRGLHALGPRVQCQGRKRRAQHPRAAWLLVSKRSMRDISSSRRPGRAQLFVGAGEPRNSA